jgi:hypothetical protein
MNAIEIINAIFIGIYISSAVVVIILMCKKLNTTNNGNDEDSDTDIESAYSEKI